jgi:hypothetical protein
MLNPMGVSFGFLTKTFQFLFCFFQRMKSLEDNFLDFFPSKSGLKPKQPSHDDKLVRFLTLTKTIHLLTSQKLHLTRLDKFQDKHEGMWSNLDENHWGKHQGFNVPRFSKEFRKTIGITCWSKVSKQSDYNKMWMEYVCGNQGLAIVTNVKTLCQEI